MLEFKFKDIDDIGPAFRQTIKAYDTFLRGGIATLEGLKLQDALDIHKSFYNHYYKNDARN